MFEPWRFLLFGAFASLIAWVFQASHRGSFSNSSVGTLTRLARPQEFLMLGIDYQLPCGLQQMCVS